MKNSPFRLLAFVCGVLGAFSGIAAAIAPEAKPNILVIISDDQGWEDYGFMGHPYIATPALDQLAAQSLTFARGYSPVPLCRPSLASIATGLYPHQPGVTGNDPALSDAGVNTQTGRANPKYARYDNTIIENARSRPHFIRDLTSRGYRSLETGQGWEGDPVQTAGCSPTLGRKPIFPPENRTGSANEAHNSTPGRLRSPRPSERPNPSPSIPAQSRSRP